MPSTFALIILSIAMIAAILLQTRGGGLGSAFGGDGMSGGQYKTRRGLEKTLFQVTIGMSVAFLYFGADQRSSAALIACARARLHLPETQAGPASAGRPVFMTGWA